MNCGILRGGSINLKGPQYARSTYICCLITTELYREIYRKREREIAVASYSRRFESECVSVCVCWCVCTWLGIQLATIKKMGDEGKMGMGEKLDMLPLRIYVLFINIMIINYNFIYNIHQSI